MSLLFIILSIFLITVPAQAREIHLTLSDALNLADQYDLTLANARLDIQSGDALVREAYSAALPSLSFTGVGGRYPLAPSMNVPAFGGRIRFQPVNDITAQLSFDQPIWLGGRVGLALDAARTYRKIARHGLSANKAQVKSAIIKEYYGLVLARQAYEVLTETYNQAERHSATVQSMFDVGMASEFDVLRAKTAVKSIEPELARAKMMVDLAETKLCQRLGLGVGDHIVIADRLEQPELQIRLSKDEAIQSAINNRPEFKMLGLQHHLSDIALQVEKRSIYWPNIFFNAVYQFQASDDHILKVGPPDWQKSLRLQIVLSVPLFDGFATPSRIEKAKIGLRRTELQRKQLEQGVNLEITAALNELTRAEEQVASLNAAVETANRAYEIACLRYEQGMGTELEVQDARLSLSNARLNLLQGLFDLKVAQAEYNRIVQNDDKLSENSTTEK